MSASWLRILGLMITSSWLFVGCNSAKKIDVGGACILNSDCNSPLVCSGGKCHDACHTSADCPPGQSCIIASDQSTVCQLPVETRCSYNSDCQPSLVCAADLKCRNQCQANVDCSSGQVCTTTKTCAEPNQVDSNNNLFAPDGGVSGCPVGAETCPCYGNDTCNTGLTCASHLCVSLGAGGSGGGGGCVQGPGNYCWSPYVDPGASAQWVTAPSGHDVHVSAAGAADGSAGMVAVLNGGVGVDLSGYDQLWFDASVPVGLPFAVSLGDTGDTCTWMQTGNGTSRYTIDLTSAGSCWPAGNCGHKRTGVVKMYFLTASWGTSYSLDIELTNLGFATVSTSPSPVTIGGDGRVALNGWCWSLLAYGVGESSSWKTPPSSSQVHVYVTDASTTGQAGMHVELPSSQQDLSTVTYLDVDAVATLTGGTSSQVSLRSTNGAYCAFTLTPVAGAHTYSFPVASPGSCGTGGGQTFDRTKVNLIEFESPWNTTATMDLSITRIAFR